MLPCAPPNTHRSARARSATADQPFALPAGRPNVCCVPCAQVFKKLCRQLGLEKWTYVRPSSRQAQVGSILLVVPAVVYLFICLFIYGSAWLNAGACGWDTPICTHTPHPRGLRRPPPSHCASALGPPAQHNPCTAGALLHHCVAAPLRLHPCTPYALAARACTDTTLTPTRPQVLHCHWLPPSRPLPVHAHGLAASSRGQAARMRSSSRTEERLAARCCRRQRCPRSRASPPLKPPASSA